MLLTSYYCNYIYYISSRFQVAASVKWPDSCGFTWCAWWPFILVHIVSHLRTLRTFAAPFFHLWIFWMTWHPFAFCPIQSHYVLTSFQPSNWCKMLFSRFQFWPTHNWQYFASPFVGIRTNLQHQASACLCRCLSAPHWVDWHPRERRRFDVCCSLLLVASCVLDWKMANIRDREANPISADSQLGFREQKSIFLPPKYHNFVPSPCNQLPQS